MFLFEGFLFTSFIPQILMFFGLVSCFAAPYMSEKEVSNTKIIQANVHNSSEIDRDKQIHFHSAIDWGKLPANYINQAIDNQKLQLLLYRSQTWEVPTHHLTHLISLCSASCIILRGPPANH